MAEIWMDVDTALSEVPVNIFPLTDDTDFKTRETAVAYDAAGMDLVWNFVTTAGVYTQTAVTPTTSGNYDWTHQGDGMYSIEIPASGGASINNDTEGFGWFSGVATGVLPWRGPIIGFRAAALNNALIDSAWSATRGLAGSALPDAAADAPGGLPISDAGGLDLDNRMPAAAAVTNINTVYNTDFATNYDTTNDKWNTRADLQTIKGQTITCAAGVTVYAHVGTAAADTAQTGDSFAVVNHGTYGNSALNTDIDALLARLTSARAGYLDNLSGGAVATSSEVTAMQNNTRVVRVVPDVIERPDSGTTTYRVELLLYDAVGNMEAPDSAPTIELVNQAGTSRASRLDSATMTLVETGRYRAIYTADSADTLEQLVWTFSVTEGGATRKYGNQSLIVDTTAVDFTAADRTKLDTIYGKMPTRPYLAASTANTGAILPSDLGMAAADLDSQLASISSDVGTLLGRITSTLFSGITSLAQWLGLMAGKQTGNTTARNEMRATGGGSGTYSETTDSLEALRDRGDAAWTTGSGGGGGGDANLVSVNGIPVETGQINITVVNTTTVQQGTLVLYRSADYSVANGNPILFTDVANIDSADNLYLTIVDNQAETAVFTRKVAAAFSEVDETATFAATAAELTVDSGKNYAFVVERKFGTEYNPILWGPCTIKDNNRTFPS